MAASKQIDLTLNALLPCCRDDRKAVVVVNVFCGEERRLIVECGNKRAATAYVREPTEPIPESARSIRVPRETKQPAGKQKRDAARVPGFIAISTRHAQVISPQRTHSPRANPSPSMRAPVQLVLRFAPARRAARTGRLRGVPVADMRAAPIRDAIRALPRAGDFDHETCSSKMKSEPCVSGTRARIVPIEGAERRHIGMARRTRPASGLAIELPHPLRYDGRSTSAGDGTSRGASSEGIHSAFAAAGRPSKRVVNQGLTNVIDL
jgi:hypothetical protein